MIMIDLTVERDLGLLVQPSSTWHTLECAVHMKQDIHSVIGTSYIIEY